MRIMLGPDNVMQLKATEHKSTEPSDLFIYFCASRFLLCFTYSYFRIEIGIRAADMSDELLLEWKEWDRCIFGIVRAKFKCVRSIDG